MALLKLLALLALLLGVAYAGAYRWSDEDRGHGGSVSHHRWVGNVRHSGRDHKWHRGGSDENHGHSHRKSHKKSHKKRSHKKSRKSSGKKHSGGGHRKWH